VSATEEPRQPPAGSGSEQEEDELERLSTQELHDRSLSWAERHLDVKFFWRLLKAIPTAEAITGDEGEAEYDVQSAKGLLTDALKSGEGELGEALRPLFIEYLRNHPGALR
jgi:hypothetical protein